MVPSLPPHRVKSWQKTSTKWGLSGVLCNCKTWTKKQVYFWSLVGAESGLISRIIRVSRERIGIYPLWCVMAWYYSPSQSGGLNPIEKPPPFCLLQALNYLEQTSSAYGKFITALSPLCNKYEHKRIQAHVLNSRSVRFWWYVKTSVWTREAEVEKQHHYYNVFVVSV